MTLLLVGGASGIGRATALRAVRPEGATVILDRDGDGVERVVRELTSRGGAAHAVVGDVRDESSRVEAVDLASRTKEGLRQVAYCAGTIGGDAPLADIDTSAWHEILDVNLTSAALLLRAALPAMVARGGGAIVLVASVGALRGRRRLAAYSASKAGLLGLTRSVAADYGEAGVRVNCVCPGPTETPMTAGLSTRGPANALGRSADPDDVARAITWLLSDDAAWVNGTDVAVDQAETAVASGMFRSRPITREEPT